MFRLVWILVLGLLFGCSQPEPVETQPEATVPETSPEAAAQSFGPGVVNLTVVNETARQLVLLYVSASGDNDWGEDLLEGGIVAPGEALTFVLGPGVWDVKCVLEDEDEVIFPQLELEADDYVLSLLPDEEGMGEGEDEHDDE